MTKSDQIRILNNKIRGNNAQYNLDRQNAEISAYSNGDLDKYEYLTNQDLGYKPDALQQAKFEYSPLGKGFYGKQDKKEDKTKRVGIFQRLKNIEENISGKDNNEKVGIFRIIKGIKDRGININNDDEAIREIRNNIQNLRGQDVRANNFNEMTDEIRNHIDNLRRQGFNVKIEDAQINYLIDKIREETKQQQDFTNFINEYINQPLVARCRGKEISTQDINIAFNDYLNGELSIEQFLNDFENFINNEDIPFVRDMNSRATGITNKQKEMIKYGKNLMRLVRNRIPTANIPDIPQRGKGATAKHITKGIDSVVKILKPNQMFARLPIILAQVQAGNNSQQLKNEVRQLLYSLYRSKKVNKSIYKKLFDTI